MQELVQRMNLSANLLMRGPHELDKRMGGPQQASSSMTRRTTHGLVSSGVRGEEAPTPPPPPTPDEDLKVEMAAATNAAQAFAAMKKWVADR